MELEEEGMQLDEGMELEEEGMQLDQGMDLRRRLL
jgi:hypothetical protein